MMIIRVNTAANLGTVPESCINSSILATTELNIAVWCKSSFRILV